MTGLQYDPYIELFSIFFDQRRTVVVIALQYKHETMKSTHHPSIVDATGPQVLLAYFVGKLNTYAKPPKKIGMSMGLNEKVKTIPPSQTFCSPPHMLLSIFVVILNI